jgi:imidazolonepropionase
MQVDRILRNARIATMAAGGAPYGALEDASLAVRDGLIEWVGPEREAPAMAAAETVDLEARWVTPGLVDCHTHLVYAGNRAAEFEQRLQGASYADIARAGGGILSTVRATREASVEELVRQSLPRLDRLIGEGVTTVEIKSGYGLDAEHECKMLRAARALSRRRHVQVVTTFLGAHALPPEAGGDHEAYIRDVCEDQLPTVLREHLADAVDAFCEGIAFSPSQVRQVLAAATQFGLPVKLHAEQLSDLSGAALAAEFGALSADHLEHASEASVAAMAAAGTVAVLLPGAFYFLRDTRVPPVERFRHHGVPIALATDCNPGSSPLSSLLLALNMGCTLFGLTPEEALSGVTRNGAAALGLGEHIGTLERGKRCDLAVWDIEHPAELAYAMGFNPVHSRVFGGRE